MAIDKRLNWIDACKALAILAIYCGHWVTPDGRLASFVYLYHLQFFFLLSGFFYYKLKRLSYLEHITDRCKKIIVPLIFFGLLNIIFFNFIDNFTPREIVNQIMLLLEGVYSLKFVAPQLWFLSSLFSIQIIYFLLNKLLKRKIIIILLSLVLLYISHTTQIFKTVLFFNIQTIPDYLFFFALGDVVFQRLKNFEHTNLTNRGKAFIILLGVFTISIGYSSYAFGANFYVHFGISKIQNQLLIQIYLLFLALTIITANIFISHIFSKSRLILEIGKNTLILMGVEILVKELILHVVDLFGMPVHIINGLQVIIFSILAILFSKILFFRFFNDHIPWVFGRRI